MKIIDSHAHIFPHKIAEKATESISAFYFNRDMAHNASSEELLASGRKAGVEKYLVFSTATSEKQVRSINDFILSEAKEHPEFLPVGTMHADFANFEEEMERISAAGMKGIKLHPDFQRFNFDDERMFAVYELLQKKEMFVITHSGDYRYGYSHPERVARIAKKYKKLKIIAAHCGGWSQWKEARECVVLPNVWVDTSSSMGFTDEDIINETIRCYGEDKIFFGTDFPMWDHKEELEHLFKLGIKDSTMEKILYDNFAEFYGLK